MSVSILDVVVVVWLFGITAMIMIYESTEKVNDDEQQHRPR